MTRTLVGLTAILLLALLGSASWQALVSPPPLLLTPGVTDVRVRVTALGRQRIVYQAPGEPDAWRAVIAARLLADGWVDLEGDNPFVSHRRFRRVTLYPLVDVVEYVELRGGPNEAAIGYGWQLVPALWRLDYRSDIARDKYSDWKRFVPTGHLAT